MLRRFGLNRNLIVMCVTIFLNVFFQSMWNPVLALYFRDLGANSWEIGISFTLMGIARTIFAILGGAAADRWGRKRLLAIPAYAMVPLYMIAANTGNWVLVLAMLVSANAMNALTGPAFSAIIAESSSEDRVARSFGFSESAVIGGLVAGPIAGASLIGIFNIPTLILLNAIVLIISASLRAFALREPPHRVTQAILPRLRTAIDSNVRWYLLLGTLVTMSFSLCFGPYFAILARDNWHNSEAEINLLFAAGNAASMVGILLGRQSDRWGARRVFMLGMSAYALSAIAWGIAPSWEWGLVPLLIAFGFSEAAFVAQQTLQVEITHPETRTSVFGLMSTTTGVIGGLGPSLGAWLITFGGNPMPFLAGGALAVLTLATITPIRKRQQTVVQRGTVSAQAE